MGQDVARMTLQQDWGYVKNPDNGFFAFITYNPPPLKINEDIYSSIGDTPVPDNWWYWFPFMLQAHGKTQFEQQLIFTIFSNWLEAYLIVGPENRCIGW